MTQKQYVYIQTLAKTLNFTHAAEELGISHPSLSQYVKKAEREIGTKAVKRYLHTALFHRGRIIL